jgi:hypothetical protein
LKNVFIEIKYTEKIIHGVGSAKATIHLAIQIPNAPLQAANTGVAAITLPGTVPKVKPAAEKQAQTIPAHPA